MTDEHPACRPWEELRRHCRVLRQRRSGPGGQHRNKVETAVVIVHPDSGCRGEASERRSQEQNRLMAIRRLRLCLALSVRCPPGPQRSPRWQRRCRGGRLSISVLHDEHPMLLAEALDVLEGAEMDVAAAAAALQCSVSQLVRLLRSEPRALQQLNAARAEQGLRALK
jgi:hypothetical protein